MNTTEDLIASFDDLAALDRGTVIVSPNYMDPFSIIPGYPYRGVPYGYLLVNAATGHKTTPAEIGPDFLPARVVYRAAWAA